MKIMEDTFNYHSLFEVSEVDLVYRTKIKPSARPKITSPQQSYQLLLKCWDEEKINLVEQFKVLLLNRAKKVLGIYEMSTGGITTTVADPKLIFIAALKAGACSIIISHYAKYILM
ncbi:MAG: JAB domain-containing protein [Chitinophagaceae bacterium]